MIEQEDLPAGVWVESRERADGDSGEAACPEVQDIALVVREAREDDVGRREAGGQEAGGVR